MLRKFALSAAAATLAVAPIVAQAAPARVAAPVSEEEELAGGILWPVIGALVLGLVVFLLVDDGDEDPVSP